MTHDYTTVVEIPDDLYQAGREACAAHAATIWAERAQQLGYTPVGETADDGTQIWHLRMNMRTEFESGKHYLHLQGPVIDDAEEAIADHMADPYDGT